MPKGLISKRRQIMEITIAILTGLVIAYLAILLFAAVYSERLIFPRIPASYRDTANILKLETRAGDIISAVYLQNPAADYTLLYSHGNGEDLGRIAHVLDYYQQFGFNVMAYDYPGYGTSSGKPSERGTYAAIDAAYAYLVQQQAVPADRIILYGRSVGGGPSLYLAEKAEVAGVILEGTFVSAFRVMTHFPLLPIDRFPNLRRIGEIDEPVLVIHGTEDRTIPFWHGKRLIEKAPGPANTYFWVEGAGHNDIIDQADETYWETLISFLKNIEEFAAQKTTT